MHVLNMANERIQILAALAEDGATAARNRISSLKANVFATLMSQTRASRVSHARATTLPALGGLFGGLLFATPTTLLIVPYLFAMLRKRNDGVAAYGLFEELPNE